MQHMADHVLHDAAIASNRSLSAFVLEPALEQAE